MSCGRIRVLKGRFSTGMCTLWVLGVKFDLELKIVHQPGKDLVRVDALSRMYSSMVCRRWVERDRVLRQARRLRVPEVMFELVCDM